MQPNPVPQPEMLQVVLDGPAQQGLGRERSLLERSCLKEIEKVNINRLGKDKWQCCTNTVSDEELFPKL